MIIHYERTNKNGILLSVQWSVLVEWRSETDEEGDEEVWKVTRRYPSRYGGNRRNDGKKRKKHK